MYFPNWLIQMQAQERLREMRAQLAWSQWCLGLYEIERSRKHNQTKKFKRGSKKGRKR